MYSYWRVGANLGTRLKVGKLIHVFPHICLVSGKLVTKTHRKPLPEFTVQLPHSWWCESRVIRAPRWGTDSDGSGSLLGEHLDISCELKTLSDKETCRKSGELCSLQILGLFECNRQRQPPMEHTSAPLRLRGETTCQQLLNRFVLLSCRDDGWFTYHLLGSLMKTCHELMEALYRINTFFQLCNLLSDVRRTASNPLVFKSGVRKL